MPLPDDGNHEEDQPPVEAIGDGGGSDKPRRPTAVGAGSPDDDFEERIADLRRFELDALEDSPVPADEILSWPIPGLTFVRIDGILRSWELEQEEQQRRNQQPRQQDPNALPKRMYLMEDVLTGLNSQKANIAYFVLGSKTSVNYYMGISLQQAPEGLAEDDLAVVCYEIQKSILHSVYNGVDINKKIFAAGDLKAMIAPLAGNVGIVSGVASLKSPGSDLLESERIECIASGLQGLDFGMLILAAPVPSKMVSDEEFIVLDELQKAQENEDAEKKRRIKYYLELQDAYLKQIQLGQAIGHWQVGVYFFAPKPDVFVRLRSLIKATYTDETSRPTPLRTHVFPGLKDHLLSFGLLRNRHTNTKHKLFSYKFLSPLNSRMLSAYIHLPRREMSGFNVRRSAPYCIEPFDPKSPRSIVLGNILDRCLDTGHQYRIDLETLRENMIITGVTGSGKTNLAICICNQLLSYKIPFLVIEPSGSTWRTFLISPENLNYHGQVFTAGDNSVSPFKFNPLQIMEGVNPFSHIESLVSIFTESFSLPPFASKILGQALKNLYVERGWDLNATMDEPSARSNLDRVNLSPQVQPTLRDLVDLLSTIADTFDVSGELETAKFFPSSLADFVLGSGGSLFDSSESISPDQLFQYPTVVELKTFSKKSEKSILVKLLLLFLSEYKQSNNSGVVILEHVLLVEDAGLATSSLNCTRIAGEGLIAIEQCPSRLPLEFLTNACVKVAHRVVAVDDRDSMAFCMHLDNLQARSLTALGQGRSIVSSAVHEGKYHLALQFDNSQSYPPPDTPEESDEFVRAAMKNRNKPC